MILVVDANIIVAELLRKRGRELLRDPRLDLRVSERVNEESHHELSRRVGTIVDQGRMDRDTADTLLEAALVVAADEMIVVPEAAYSAYLERATYRIPRDPDDVPTVALALALGGDAGRCGIWTNDGDFLGCGLPTWSTNTLVAHLTYIERERA